MKLGTQAVLAALILAASGLAYVYVLRDGDDASAARGGGRGGDVRVFTAPAVFAPTRTRLEAVGTAEAARSATIHAPVAGAVTEVNFSPDQQVGAGDVLLRLDSRSERLAVNLAEVRVKDARQLLARLERAASAGAVAATTIDQARTTLEAARIELRQAEKALADRTVRAPFDGYIGLTDVHVGDRIDPDDPIATLDDRGALMIAFSAPELFHGRIKVGQPVSVRAWAGDLAAVEGEVIDVDSRIDPETRGFVLRARAPNPDDALRPGMSFAVAIDLLGQHYLKAPEAAVQWGAGGAYLWVVRDGKAERVNVRIVERQPGVALVDAPVAEGEQIVVEGIQRVRAGRPVDTAPAAGGS